MAVDCGGVQPKCELPLARDWDSAWREIVRPWLAAPGDLRRNFVLVPTRGQAAALKLRCVRENLPLLGVEFLTPSLARQKWRALARSAPDAPEILRKTALGRELLLLGLRCLIEERLAPLTPEDPSWGLWKSLQSDPDRALDAFDELLQAGFTAADFPLDPLRAIFTGLAAWVEACDHTLAPLQAAHAAVTPVGPEAARLGERLLLFGFTAESWSDFFDLAALARRASDVTVILPEPELRGAGASDEKWIEIWSALLGVEPRVGEGPAAENAGAAVAALWSAGGGGSAENARVVVGHSRTDEMALVAEEIGRLLAAGGENIGVVFPAADAAHLELVRLLAARELPFTDLIGTSGPPPIDQLLQRGLLQFYERGARLEELMALWPRLRALSLVEISPGEAREVCERLFDELQTHQLAPYVERLTASGRPAPREVGRVAALLLPAWPDALTLAEAVQLFETACARFRVIPPEWPALTAFAARETRRLPARCVFPTLASFLPQKLPAADSPGRGKFAPVTLATRRRAIGSAWSHLIFVESNAGVWPRRAEPGPWLNDEQRKALGERARFSLGLFSGDDRFALEKADYQQLARDTREQVIFSAALHEEEEPELRLAPNAWLERVLLAREWGPGPRPAIDEAFARLARSGPAASAAPPPWSWTENWLRRRDPAAPFDDWFFSGDPAATRPPRLAARLIERAVSDPAELWFEGVLGVKPVRWTPLVRARKKALGQLAHRMLARALLGPPAEGGFHQRPEEPAARAALRAALAELRGRWPRDRYWESLHGELNELCARLLEKVCTLRTGPFVAVEHRLPPGASVPVGAGDRLAVDGRMDLVFLDRPAWTGATVDIVDFKTGADAALSAERMARGASLQLGVYLAAAASLGVAAGRVWMVKPDATENAALELAELPHALAALEQLGRHLATGRYGALTPDRTRFAHGFDWPLACTPIPHATLVKKFEATFGRAQFETDEDAEGGEG